MTSFQFNKLRTLGIAATLFCLIACGSLWAQNTSRNVIYTAAGTFASTQVSGADLLKLAGQPFSLSVIANSSTVPTSNGGHWAIFSDLLMSGTVQSGLIPPPPTVIHCTPHTKGCASLELATGNPDVDMLGMGAPITVIEEQLTIGAALSLPKGTLVNPLIRLFTAPVTLGPTSGTVQYSNGTATTVLAIASGTLSTKLQTGPNTDPPGVTLHIGGAQAITLHADGSQSVRAVHAAPGGAGSPEETLTLQFYASGVRNATDVHVRIGGQEVPVIYAGASNYFDGLDQISVQVPRSLIGSGEADVVATVDGHTSNAVRINLQ